MNNLLKSKAMLVSLSVHKFNPSKTDKRVTKDVLVAHGAADKTGKFTKVLLPEEAVEPFSKVESRLRIFHTTNTLPWDEDGMRVLPIDNFDSYKDGVKQALAEWETLKRAFRPEYERWRDVQQIRLNGLFNPKDYPPVDKVMEKFAIETRWLPMPDKEDFRVSLAADALSELEQSVEDRVSRAAAAARNDLYSRLAKRLEHISSTFSKEEPRFHDTIITNLRELCRLIPSLNVTGDPEIENLRITVLERVAQFDPDDLREDETKRSEAKQSADDILASMGLLSSVG